MTDLFQHAAEQALRLRDTGMANAVAAQDRSSPSWSERAYAALVELATRQPTVHVDDILRSFHEQPVHANAWGAVWQRAIRQNIIRHSGRVRRCETDPKKHAHLSPEYSSLVYRDNSIRQFQAADQECRARSASVVMTGAASDLKPDKTITSR